MMKKLPAITILPLKSTDIVTEIIPISRMKGCTVDLVTIRHGAAPYKKNQCGKLESLIKGEGHDED